MDNIEKGPAAIALALIAKRVIALRDSVTNLRKVVAGPGYHKPKPRPKPKTARKRDQREYMRIYNIARGHAKRVYKECLSCSKPAAHNRVRCDKCLERGRIAQRKYHHKMGSSATGKW